MPELSAIARERAALATIADAIVAASVGKGLRIAVACPTSHLAVADYLAQALHARGRACRCLTVTPNPAAADDMPPNRQDGKRDLTIVVITSGLVTETDRGVQRVNISVTSAVPTARDRDVSHQRSDEVDSPPGSTPDIILDYREPHGPKIRYMAPFLSAGNQQ
ncbi:hypothetical protein [Micromonospora purpureochromogenes]|uniref:Helicase conserved C-terminal domain-containing protein n=1 Tax=Micromonospora purpureochromogenes TaxID=47872 RepID=A0ABX2RN34_9ACTN|nr:hypothetical protein [Micromonospora purpureochromogenes]NYF56684.1 hypothetical protein [Micromonospora purpureochromogenes]